MRDLLSAEYRTIESVKGPLLFISRPSRAALGDLVTIIVGADDMRAGQIIELSERFAVAQVFGPTGKINPDTTVVRFSEEGAAINLSPLILGRVFSGAGTAMDGMPEPPPFVRRGIHGSAINPVQRDMPRDFIQTGISAIDGMNTLVRGQKLPIFSGAGLPANEIATHIIANAGAPKEGEQFALVFAAMGITSREADYFMGAFMASGAIEHSVVFLNLADDPVIERLLTPRFALTAAEYLAFELDMQALVVLTDMTHYCNALREVSSSREEIPGRRGYPGYMYTDLAGIYERAGRIKGRKGSVTQTPILTMPDDDITHPVPDLTGYITEGQIVLDRGLHRKGVFPPINVLPSLSRLMDHGIGPGRTREDHRQWSDQLYMLYARGMEQRRVASIIGEEGLSETDRSYLKFAEMFESEFLGQGSQSRTMTETLEAGWRLMATMPDTELVRVSRDFIAKYRPKLENNNGAVNHSG
ncbi:MAG: V-type ATP synthase subunit B [Nitrospinae bacterium]|nr:V-type ATP synthase subunit B [Nitrospinota bacterium]